MFCFTQSLNGSVRAWPDVVTCCPGIFPGSSAGTIRWPGQCRLHYRDDTRSVQSSRAQSISAEYILMSMTGVPSNASSPRTFRTPSFTSRRSTMQSETGFGRSGERMANTPFSADVPGGLPGEPSGLPGRTSRGPRGASSPRSARGRGGIFHQSRSRRWYRTGVPAGGHRPLPCTGGADRWSSIGWSHA